MDQEVKDKLNEWFTNARATWEHMFPETPEYLPSDTEEHTETINIKAA